MLISPIKNSSKIIYIMGTGRSGTTILEILLKSSPSISGFGEITHSYKDGFINNKVCACGLPSRSCSTWNKIIMEYKKLSCSADNIFKRFESHKFFIPNQLGIYKHSKLKKYNDINIAIFNILSSVNLNEYIIDSSKYAGRAFFLSKIFGSKLNVISITRSPSELIDAFKKDNQHEQKSKNILNFSIYFFYVLFCMRICSFRLNGKHISIRYEDLVKSPDHVLSMIESKFNIDLSISKETILKQKPMNPEHILTGNRLRHQKNIVFIKRNKTKEISLSLIEKTTAFFLSIYRFCLGY